MEDVGAVRSSWLMPDACSSLCFECGVSFSAFTRRHHCAQCGFVFCRRCCSTFLDGAAVHLQAGFRVRICRACVELQYMHGHIALSQQQQQLLRRQQHLDSQQQAEQIPHGQFHPPPPQQDLQQRVPQEIPQQQVQQHSWRQHRNLLKEQVTEQAAGHTKHPQRHVLTRRQGCHCMLKRKYGSTASSPSSSPIPPCSPLWGAAEYPGQQNAAPAETKRKSTSLLPNSFASSSATSTDYCNVRASPTAAVAPFLREQPKLGARAAASAEISLDICLSSDQLVVRSPGTSILYTGSSNSSQPLTTACAKHPMQHLRNTPHTHRQETSATVFASNTAGASVTSRMFSARTAAAWTECAATADFATALPTECDTVAAKAPASTRAIRADSTPNVAASQETSKHHGRSSSSIRCSTPHSPSTDTISFAATGRPHMPSCRSFPYVWEPLYFSVSQRSSQQQQQSSRHCLKQRQRLERNTTSPEEQQQHPSFPDLDFERDRVDSEQMSRCQQQTRAWPPCHCSSTSAARYRSLPAMDEIAPLNAHVSSITNTTSIAPSRHPPSTPAYHSIPTLASPSASISPAAAPPFQPQSTGRLSFPGAEVLATVSLEIPASGEPFSPPHASCAAAASSSTRTIRKCSPASCDTSATTLRPPFSLSFAPSSEAATAKCFSSLGRGSAHHNFAPSAVSALTAASSPSAAVPDAGGAAPSVDALSSRLHAACGRFCFAGTSACCSHCSAEASANRTAAVRERQQREATSLPLLIPLGSAAERASRFLLESMRLHCLLVGLSPSLHAELLFLLAVTVVRPLRLPRPPLRQQASPLGRSWNSRAAPLSSLISNSQCFNPFASFSPRVASTTSFSAAATHRTGFNLFDSVKVKRMYGGSITDSFYIHGIVFSTAITQKVLQQLRLERPRVILLSFYLGLARDRPRTVNCAAGGDHGRQAGTGNRIVSAGESPVKIATSLSKITRSLTRTSWRVVDKATSFFRWFLRGALFRYNAHLGTECEAANPVAGCLPPATLASSCTQGSARGISASAAAVPAAYPQVSPCGRREENATAAGQRTPALLTTGTTSVFSTATATCQHGYPDAREEGDGAGAACLTCAGGGQGDVRFMRLQVLREQEAKHASILVSKICTLQPDLIVSSSDASFLMQQWLKKLNIAFLPNVPARTLQRISRYINAPILPSLDLAAAAVAAGAATASRCPRSTPVVISDATDTLAGASPSVVAVPAATAALRAEEFFIIEGPTASPQEPGSIKKNSSDRPWISAEDALQITPSGQAPARPWGRCGLFALCPFLPSTASSAERQPTSLCMWGTHDACCCVRPTPACMNKTHEVAACVHSVRSRSARREDDLSEGAALKDRVQIEASRQGPVAASRALAFFVKCPPSRGATICLRGRGVEARVNNDYNLQTPKDRGSFLEVYTENTGSLRNEHKHPEHPPHPKICGHEDHPQERSQQRARQLRLNQQVPQHQEEKERPGQQNIQQPEQLQQPELQCWQARIGRVKSLQYKAVAPASDTLCAGVDELLLAKRVLRRGLLVALSLQQELRFVAASCPSRGRKSCAKYTSAACAASEASDGSYIPVHQGSASKAVAGGAAAAPLSRHDENIPIREVTKPQKAAPDSWDPIESDNLCTTGNTTIERDGACPVRHSEDVSLGTRTRTDTSEASCRAGRRLEAESCAQQSSAQHYAKPCQRSCDIKASGCCCCSCTFSIHQHCCRGMRFTCPCCCHFVSRPRFSHPSIILPLPRAEAKTDVLVRASSCFGTSASSAVSAAASNASMSADASSDTRFLLRVGRQPRREPRQQGSSAPFSPPLSIGTISEETSAAGAAPTNDLSPELTLEALLQESYLHKRLCDWARLSLSSSTVKPPVLLLAYHLLTSAIPPCAADPSITQHIPDDLGETAASPTPPALRCDEAKLAVYLLQQRPPFHAQLYKQQPHLAQAVRGCGPPAQPQELRKQEEDSLPNEGLVLQALTPLASKEQQQQQSSQQAAGIRRRGSHQECVTPVGTQARATANPHVLASFRKARRPLSLAENLQPNYKSIREKRAVLQNLSEAERLLRGGSDIQRVQQLGEPTAAVIYTWKPSSLTTAGKAAGGTHLASATHDFWSSKSPTGRVDGGSKASSLPSSIRSKLARLDPGAAGGAIPKTAAVFGAAARVTAAAASTAVSAAKLNREAASEARSSTASHFTANSLLQAGARAAAAHFKASAAATRALTEKGGKRQREKEARSPVRLRSCSPEGLLAEIYAAEKTAASAAALDAFSVPSAGIRGLGSASSHSYASSSASAASTIVVGMSPSVCVADVGAAHSLAFSAPRSRSGSAAGCMSMEAAPVETPAGTLPSHVRRQLQGLLPQLLVGLYRPAAQRLQVLSSWSFNKQQCDAPLQQHELLLLQPSHAGDCTSPFSVEDLGLAHSMPQFKTFPVFPYSTAPLDDPLHPSASLVQIGSSAPFTGSSSAWATHGSSAQPLACTWAQPQLRQVTRLQKAALEKDLLRGKQRQTFASPKHCEVQASASLTVKQSSPAAAVAGEGPTVESGLFYFPFISPFVNGTVETLREAVLLRCDAAAAIASNRKCPAGSSRCKGFLLEHSLRLESLEARVVVSFSLVR